MNTPTNSHHGQPVLATGAPLEQARAAMVLIHGRGASAEDILSLAAEFGAEDVAYLAPQAANSTWYPNRFIVPLAQNEPWFSSAITTLDRLLEHVAAAHSSRADDSAGLLAGRMPGAGVCRAAPAALRRRGGAVGRTDRERRPATYLRRLAERHAGIPRL